MAREEIIVSRKQREEAYELASAYLSSAFDSLTKDQIADLYKLLQDDHIILYEALKDVIELEKTIR